MKPIRLPEPPSPKVGAGVADIFEGGVYGVVRRAVVIGNGFAGSENQSIGLVRALGLADKHVLYVSSREPKRNLVLLVGFHMLKICLNRQIACD